MYGMRSAQIVQVAHEAGALVKVILETCYLTDAQKVTACHLSEEAGADFVKTSTGYGTKGCTIQDLQLMRRSVSERVQVKGSGGIRDLDTVLSAPGGGRHALRGQRDSGHHGGGGEALRGGNPSGSGYAQGHGRRLLSGKRPEQDAVPCPGRMNAHHQNLHL